MGTIGRSSDWKGIEPGEVLRAGGVTRSRLALTAFLTALAIWVFVYKAAPKMPDFEVYWKAASRAARAELLYRPTDGHYQFKYLPAFAVLAIPLGRMPLSTAEIVWFATSVALLVTLLALAVRLPVERRKPVRWLVVLTVLAFGKFYAQELVLGQVNILFAVIATAAFLAMRSGREVSAGALVALGIVIKPYAVLFLPWLVARRRLPSVVSATVGLAVVLVLPAVLYGWEGNSALHREWWRTVSETTAPNLSLYDNVSLAAMYFRWFGPGPLSRRLALGTAALLLSLVALVFIGRRGIAFPEGVEGAMLLTLMPLLSPQGWHYVFLIATPAIVYLANYEDLLPRPLRVVTIAAVAAIGFSLFDVMGRAAYSTFMRLSIISLCFFVVLAALSTLRLRKIA
jgi:Glycosyltransferase family 87